MRTAKTFFLVLFSWFFLVQGNGTSTDSSGFSTVVGPFKSQQQCEKIAKEASARIDRTWVTYRSTTCWEAPEIK
jgi:hypothetical protein